MTPQVLPHIQDSIVEEDEMGGEDDNRKENRSAVPLRLNQPYAHELLLRKQLKEKSSAKGGHARAGSFRGKAGRGNALPAQPSNELGDSIVSSRQRIEQKRARIDMIQSQVGHSKDRKLRVNAKITLSGARHRAEHPGSPQGLNKRFGQATHQF